MNWKTLALKKHPGATCKREGTLYVVRDAWGRVITARRGCSNAWKQAHANKALPPPQGD